MLQPDLDPWRVLRSFLATVDSRRVPDIIDRCGLRVDWSLTEKQNYSHSTRWAEYRPRLDAAYEALESDDDRLRVAFTLATELSAKYGLDKEMNQALEQIGWGLRGGSLVAVGTSARELFFPKGSEHDAYVEIRGLIKRASKLVDIVDPYVDGSILTLLSGCANNGTQFRILTARYTPDLSLQADKWRKQHPQNTLAIRITKEFHDRFIILDNDICWHIGSSIKDAGNKVSMISRIQDDLPRTAVIQQFQESWGAAKDLEVVVNSNRGSRNRPEFILNDGRAVKCHWYGNECRLEHPVLQVVDRAIEGGVSYTASISEEAKSTLARFKYQLLDSCGHNCEPEIAKLAVRRVGSDEPPALTGEGETEVQVDQDCKIEYLVNGDFHTHDVEVTIHLLGFKLGG